MRTAIASLEPVVWAKVEGGNSKKEKKEKTTKKIMDLFFIIINR